MNGQISVTLLGIKESEDEQMSVIDLLEALKKDAENYAKQGDSSVKRNRHMNELSEGEGIEQWHIEAVLVDFINHIAGRYCVDYALYTADIKPN